eukprot:scaffold21592_cov125-Isochrysis_galbana.AAC.1
MAGCVCAGHTYAWTCVWMHPTTRQTPGPSSPVTRCTRIDEPTGGHLPNARATALNGTTHHPPIGARRIRPWLALSCAKCGHLACGWMTPQGTLARNRQ